MLNHYFSLNFTTLRKKVQICSKSFREITFNPQNTHDYIMNFRALS